MRTQFEEVQLVQNKVKERLQQSSADTERVQSELAERVEQLENENSVLSAKFDDLTATKENEIEELRSSLDKLEEDIKVDQIECSFKLLLSPYFCLVCQSQRSRSYRSEKSAQR